MSSWSGAQESQCENRVMIFLLAFFFELVVLYLLSRILMIRLFVLFGRLFGSRSIAVSLVTLVLFPGTVVHELSHLFTAEILGVPTGKLILVPEEIRPLSFSKSAPDRLRLGSVAIAKTDLLRRNLIGLAPIFTGVIVTTALANSINWTNWSNLTNWLVIYLLFSISTSLFSSREDLKEFWPLAILVGLLVLTAYLVGLKVILTRPVIESVNHILIALVQGLGLVLAINFILLLISFLISLPTSKAS